MCPVKENNSIVKIDDDQSSSRTHLLGLDISRGEIIHAVHEANFRQFIVRVKKVRKLQQPKKQLFIIYTFIIAGEPA